jgi:hypothetical protein
MARKDNSNAPIIGRAGLRRSRVVFVLIGSLLVLAALASILRSASAVGGVPIGLSKSRFPKPTLAPIGGEARVEEVVTSQAITSAISDDGGIGALDPPAWARDVSKRTPTRALPIPCSDVGTHDRGDFSFVPGWQLVSSFLSSDAEGSRVVRFRQPSQVRRGGRVAERGGREGAPITACRAPYNVPDVRQLPKLWHTHKKPKASEHTPTDLFMRTVLDDVDRANVFVATYGNTSDATCGLDLVPDIDQHLCSSTLLSAGEAKEPDRDDGGSERDGDRPMLRGLHPQLALRNNALASVRSITPHEVLVTDSDQPSALSRMVALYPPPISFEAERFADSDYLATHEERRTTKRGELQLHYRLDRKFGEWHTTFQLAPARGDFVVDLAHASYPQVAKPGPPSYYAVFGAGTLVTDGNVVTCRRGYTTGGCMWDFRLFSPAVVGQPLPSTHHFARIVAFCDYWCKGYFHFTHEHLPRLATVHHLLVEDPTIKITVPRDVGYIRQYLIDVFGYRAEQLVPVASTYMGTEQVIYSQPQRCGSIFLETVLLLRDIVFNRLGGLQRTVVASCNTSALPQVLWAERSKLHRMPRNYEHIRKTVERRFAGRVRFRDTNGMGVVDQIRAFNSADIVIGPHGANLANAMWMRHGSYLVEFVSYPYANMCYYGTAARLAVRFGAVFHGASKAGHYNSSALEVARHIDEMMSTRQPCV